LFSLKSLKEQGNLTVGPKRDVAMVKTTIRYLAKSQSKILL